ncbi:MAG: hypothetical protein U0136_13125 [Bdellovibrionota bacterium]
MTWVTRYFLLLAAIVAVPLSSAVGQQSPVEMTQRLISQIQSQRGLDAVIDDLDWDSAFAHMDPEMRKQMSINSPDDLKRQQLESYRGMPDKVAASLHSAAANATGSQAAILQTMNERLSKSVEEQNAKAASDFGETEYSIGKSSVHDNTAEVEVIQKRGETVSTGTLEFVRSGRTWKLKSAAPLSPTGGPAPLPNQLLGPPVSSPNEAVLRLH